MAPRLEREVRINSRASGQRIPLLLTIACLVSVLCCTRAPAETAKNPCEPLKREGKVAEARACFEKLARGSDPYLRAEGFWGLGQYQEANGAFKAAVEANPKNADYRVRWGQLFLERFNKAEAQSLFQEALELEPENPRALVAAARVAADRFEKKAVELAEKAVDLDPTLVEGYELLAWLALEDSDPRKAAAQADRALKMDPKALDAMALKGTVDLLEDRTDTPWMNRVFETNPVYGEAYAIAGHFFIINRRYEEGIALYRKAIEKNPQLYQARAELGVNLMRLGYEDEAREQLEICYDNGHRDAATVNTLRLMDSYSRFETFRTDRTIVKLHQKEAELLRPYMEGELKRAITTYEKKYKIKLDRPVQLEVYPDHEDFAVRTMGLPGLGALGVAFGYVVAMDSPTARKPGSFHWASTLWHELSHVFVLAATKHRVPRWFTEGMAVHEETAISPDWGDRLDPEAIKAIKDKKLLPVRELDRGFVRPSYPSQVIVSYFQAGRICDYIAKTWGYDKLLGMMHSYAERKDTPEAIQQNLGITPEELDKQFLAWLEAQTKTPVEKFGEWSKQLKTLVTLSRSDQHEQVIALGNAIRDLYPDYVDAGSVYELLAEAHEARSDKAAAMEQLMAYSKMGGRRPETVKKLAALLEEAGRKKEAAQALERLNFIYPNDEDLHRKLGSLYLDLGDSPGAIREYAAVVALKPIDQAASHFNLAKAYHGAKRLEEAKDHLLLALEAAPGYRPAQQMLLELSK
jgi:cellulose synthase operon protein C